MGIYTELRKIRARVLYGWVRHKPLPRGRLPHGLEAPLVVSLTSHAPRFATLAATLRGLLGQKVAADVIVLWVGHDDMAALPEDVRALERLGVTIRATEDVGPHTKIIPALTAYPGAFIVTADDDQYYPPGWLGRLVAGYRADRREIVCLRTHLIRLDDQGLPLPYRKWGFEKTGGDRPDLVFPTGVGGVLYPPGCFDADVTNAALFRELAPKADDLWLYWMARRHGWIFRRVGRSKPPINWPGSQEEALWKGNLGQGAGNDQQIERLVAHYGFPAPDAGSERP
ncbi:MAG: glycosyltransferase family 2 protein [Rhodobacteraceae bacterium]|nr:glycosyltransferase family 2 protein [Paracoccaceae bacterium]